MKLGAQTYTIRTFMQSERDVRRSMEKIARIGYTTVQISGIGPIDPHVLREICDENGLQIVLTHIPEGRILDDTEAVIQEHEILGCPYIGLGSMPERYRTLATEWFDYFYEDFLEPAKKIRDAGKRFMYHNHNFEFERLPGGQTILERMLAQFSPDLMGITLDTYWVQAAGADILTWIERLKDRIPCVHLKDMTVHGMEIHMAPVGEGNIDFAGVVRALERNGGTEYVLVEQDICEESPFVCLQKSYDHLQGMGLR